MMPQLRSATISNVSKDQSRLSPFEVNIRVYQMIMLRVINPMVCSNRGRVSLRLLYSMVYGGGKYPSEFVCLH